MAHRWWAGIKSTYEKFPVITNVVQAAVFMGTGDIIAQFLDRETISAAGYNFKRTAKMSCIGAVSGPPLLSYYNLLERIARSKDSTMRRNLVKVAIDQLVTAPISILAFVVMTSAAEGIDVRKSLQNRAPGLVMDNYKVWPAAQIINFTLVPPPLRTGFHQIVALGWNSYVNWKLHLGDEIESRLIPFNCENKGYRDGDDS